MQPNDELDYKDLFTNAFRALDVTANEVAVKIGINNAKLYNILNGKFKPGYDTVSQILRAYPRLNANYLLRGQPPILHQSGAEIIGVDTALVSLPAVQTTANYDPMSPDSYNFIALNGHQKIQNCIVVRLTDNTMAPKYLFGTRLLASPVPTAEWEYLNSLLVLVLYRSTLVVRRLRENELPTRNHLTLYADNSDSGYVLVRRDDLKSIWRVIDIIGVESLP